jgi:hypothetical protein
MKIEGVTIFEPSNSKGVFGVFYIIKKSAKHNIIYLRRSLMYHLIPFQTVSNRDIRAII